ncbi:MAG: biopolymer transporter ExbD [Candidatus Omnitrophota bacterium]
MKINLKTRKARIEMIPLLDMIFLVLVSFVYSFMAMTVQKGIPVKLPFAESSVEERAEYLIVTVAGANTIYLNKQPISDDSLQKEMELRRAASENVKVYINAEKGILYEKVINVIDRIRKAGIQRISLETTTSRE